MVYRLARRKQCSGSGSLYLDSLGEPCSKLSVCCPRSTVGAGRAGLFIYCKTVSEVAGKGLYLEVNVMLARYLARGFASWQGGIGIDPH
jgi:hypothetical protein